MATIKFEGDIQSLFIKNLKAARHIALIDFWLGILGIIFFMSFAIFSFLDKSYIIFYFFAAFCFLYIIAIVYGGSYLLAYRKLKNDRTLCHFVGNIEKRHMFPYYLTVSGVRYKGIHQLLNYASQMGKSTTYYEYKQYANVGDKVEITHMNGYILKISKVR